MAYIKTISPSDAQGDLKKIFDAAIHRAGKVYNILRVQSLNPKSLGASMALYMQVMKGPSPLSRAQRELLAVVVSKTNHCEY